MHGLIVNADDFGFSPEINEGVCEAHLNGVVTDASLLVRSPHAPQAVHMAEQVDLPLGLHLDFVTPYAAASRSSLGPDGHLARELFSRENHNQVCGVFTAEELLAFQDEIRQQIGAFESLAGELPTHLDYHFGLHYLPDIMFVYLTVAAEYDLPVRWGVQYAGRNPSVLAPARLCDRFRGVKNGTIQSFLDLLKDPWDGALEVICHPGHFTPLGLYDSYNQEREHELQVLVDPRLKTELASMGIQLVDYRWLKQNGIARSASRMDES